jgi:hypothetical protein
VGLLEFQGWVVVRHLQVQPGQVGGLTQAADEEVGQVWGDG